MKNSYNKLVLLIVINSVLMFLLTYANLASIDHFYPNINRGYMSIIMVSTMFIFMLIVMGNMYSNKNLNRFLYILFAVLLITGIFFIRTQTAIGNVQFLRSMIPHHSSAIVMCEESNLTDPEIVMLCEDIVEAQQEEIALMKEILTRYQ